jgi:threonine/homoserine/homoserine lactone efflux protein
MISPEMLFALMVYAFVASITPGPNNLMLMTSGINFGLKRTIPHMLGVSSGFVLMVILVGLGVMQLIDAVPASRTAITVLSAVYLLYMAWKIASNDTSPAEIGERVATAKPFTFIQAVLFQWVNPKAWTMALTAISAYAPKSSGFSGIAIVALVFGLINLPSTSSWALLGAKLRVFLSDPVRLRVFNITAALLLVATLYPMIGELTG